MSCDAKNLAVLIKTIRRTENMSLRKFGDKVGLSHAYINKLENDIDGEKRMTLTIATLVKISKALEIPLDEFLYMCGYLNINTAQKRNDVACIVTGVKTIEDILNSNIVALTAKAQELGISMNMPVKKALEILAE